MKLDIETIRRELEFYTGRFPLHAVRVAIEQREAITPLLLGALQKAADAPHDLARVPSPMLHVYAIYLLAQFRERAAYPLLVHFFSTPGEISLDVTEDLVTEGLGRILGSVCHDDLEPMKRMIEDPALNEFVRSACLQALTVLVAEEELPRAPVIDYFGALFHGRLAREPDFIWSALVSAARDLYAEELLPEIERAYDDDLVDTVYIGIESVRSALAEGQEAVLQKTRLHRRGLIEDTVTEMRWWACFEEDNSASTSARLKTARQPLGKAKKIGRNDPCPCGSGKNYKKCCFHRTA